MSFIASNKLLAGVARLLSTFEAGANFISRTVGRPSNEITTRDSGQIIELDPKYKTSRRAMPPIARSKTATVLEYHSRPEKKEPSTVLQAIEAFKQQKDPIEVLGLVKRQAQHPIDKKFQEIEDQINGLMIDMAYLERGGQIDLVMMLLEINELLGLFKTIVSHPDYKAWIPSSLQHRIRVSTLLESYVPAIIENHFKHLSQFKPSEDRDQLELLNALKNLKESIQSLGQLSRDVKFVSWGYIFIAENINHLMASLIDELPQ